MAEALEAPSSFGRGVVMAAPVSVGIWAAIAFAAHTLLHLI